MGSDDSGSIAGNHFSSTQYYIENFRSTFTFLASLTKF